MAFIFVRIVSGIRSRYITKVLFAKSRPNIHTKMIENLIILVSFILTIPILYLIVFLIMKRVTWASPTPKFFLLIFLQRFQQSLLKKDCRLH